MSETKDWVQPQVVTSGCCEGWRWHLRMTGPDNDRPQSRLAGIAYNPAAPAEVLLAIARSGGRLPRLVLAERLNGDSSLCEESPEIVAALVTAAIDTGDPHLLGRLVCTGDFPPDAIAALAVSPDHRVRAEVPWLAACPAQTLATLADDPHPEVRRAIAWQVRLSPELQAKLARDPDPVVREAIGEREDLSAEIVTILAQDEVASIRAHVVDQADDWLAEELATNPDPEARAAAAGSGRLSVEMMSALANDPVVEVRRWLSWSGNLPVPVLAILAHDPDPEIRRRVALNDATPAATLATLLVDPDDTVASAAVAQIAGQPHRPLPTLERLEASAERLSVEQLRDLVGGEYISGCEPGPRPWPVDEAEDARHTLLAQCAVSRKARLRALAAADRRLPAEIAAVLADDRDPTVRRWLARHCRHPEILNRFADAPAKGIGDALASNFHTPPDLLERLPAKPHRLARHWNASGTLLARLLDGADHVTRLAVAEHRNTPPETLAELARGDAERDVIRAACEHPALPITVMWELVEATS
ncbi:hypothetical protein EV385_3998 [Krasilnikovia cinnamomea]|uniref:Leucine rich repeat (LRR) protein n=1 Tax=Krasilnikovia cinnamomea TaxID=349313 RepID=A0A4Q7ZP25_9ACTN|nr:hypothetical protein [Krasilnikovia cinnamomea]RZU52155.1 hypothetical protein EV385_3998 [Krasilnikovia cinnamomea]